MRATKARTPAGAARNGHAVPGRRNPTGAERHRGGRIGRGAARRSSGTACQPDDHDHADAPRPLTAQACRRAKRQVVCLTGAHIDPAFPAAVVRTARVDRLGHAGGWATGAAPRVVTVPHPASPARCAHCGENIVRGAKESYEQAGGRRYCSRVCFRSSRAPQADRVCKVCGTAIVSGRGSRVTCGAAECLRTLSRQSGSRGGQRRGAGDWSPTPDQIRERCAAILAEKYGVSYATQVTL